MQLGVGTGYYFTTEVPKRFILIILIASKGNENVVIDSYNLTLNF